MTFENGMSPADMAAVFGNRRDDGYGMDAMWSNPFVYLIWIYAFRMFGGWGNGDVAAQGALTRAELYDGLNFQTITDKLDTMGQTLCQGFNSVNTNMLQGFNQANISNLQGFNQVGRDLCSGFNGVQQGMAQLGYTQAQCCCDIKQGLASLSAENYRNTCEITNTIRDEARETRELIVANTIQDLRDRLADKDRDLVEANNLISQYSQTSTIIGALQNKSPVPAYVVGYATNGMVPNGYDYTYFGSSAGGCQPCRG